VTNVILGRLQKAEKEIRDIQHRSFELKSLNADGTSTVQQVGGEWLAMANHTAAIIHRLSGRWAKALGNSELAARGWRYHQGFESLSTQEASILRALLLAQTSQTSLAESVCD